MENRSVRLYIHSDAALCTQETDFADFSAYNPLTREGLKKHFHIVDKLEYADYYFLGQIRDYNVNYDETKLLDWAKNWPEKSIIDIEGDWCVRKIPQPFTKCIISISGPDRSWLPSWDRVFVRPPMSRNLKYLCEKWDQIIPFEDIINCLYFEGQVVTKNRAILLEVLYDFPRRKRLVAGGNPWSIISDRFWILPKREWNGMLEPDKESAESYRDKLRNVRFSLCPKGVGGSSVRFYESCYYGAVPVIFGTDVLLGESWYDTSFVIREPYYNDKEEIKETLHRVLEMSDEEAKDRSEKARQYFTNVVVPFYSNSTRMFKEWLINLDSPAEKN